MTSKAISRSEATEQAIRLRKQGLTFAKIADHLKGLGLLARDGQPMKEMAVRYMIISAEKKDRQEVKRELEDERKYDSDRSFKENVKILLSLKEFSPDMKLKLLEVIAEDKVGDNIVPILERLDKSHQARKASGDR